MYVYGLCLLFDFATKNLHFATIFYHLVDKCDLRILLISSPALGNHSPPVLLLRASFPLTVVH